MNRLVSHKCSICGGEQFRRLNRYDGWFSEDLCVAVCRNCGVVCLNPRMSEEDYEIYYRTRYYGEYQPKPNPECEKVTEDSRGAKICDDILPCIERSSIVLEIGCGTGGNLITLRNRGFSNVAGLDPSPDCCSIVRSYGINCINSALLPYALDSNNPDAFDLIILSHMLEHFVEPDVSLRLIRSLLRENGLVYILVPNLYGHIGQDPRDQFALPHTFYFSISTLKALLNNNGFVLEQRFSSNKDEIAVLARKSIGTDIPVMVENEYDRAIKYLKMDRMYMNYAWRALGRALRRVLSKLLKTVLPVSAYEFIRTRYRRI